MDARCSGDGLPESARPGRWPPACAHRSLAAEAGTGQRGVLGQPETAPQQPLLLGGLGVLATGLATDDDALWQAGHAAFQKGIDDIQDDGSLPLEMARGQRALHYHDYALAPLVMMAELASARPGLVCEQGSRDRPPGATGHRRQQGPCMVQPAHRRCPVAPAGQRLGRVLPPALTGWRRVRRRACARTVPLATAGRRPHADGHAGHRAHTAAIALCFSSSDGPAAAGA